MKKGISLIVLVLTVIVSVIILGVIIINSKTPILGSQKSVLRSDISQLEILMSIYKVRNDGVINFENIDLDVSSYSEDEIKQFEGENIQDNKINLYIIDLKAIDAESVTYGKLEMSEKDRYLYSVDTGKVYYEQGLVAGEGKYYYVQEDE